MKNIFKQLGLAASITIGPMMVFADVLVAWDVNGVDVADGTGVDNSAFPYTKTATTLRTNVSEGTLALGFDAPSGVNDMYGFKFSASTHQDSLAGAISNDHYIQFTLAAEVGYRFDLSSIEMNGQSGTSGPDDIALMSNVDGYNAGDEMASLTGRQGLAGGWDTELGGWGGRIDLSDPQYQDLTTVTFRIYGWNSTGTASGGIRGLTGDDLVVNGTIEAIPEPAAAGLIGLAGLGLLVARRFLG